MIRFLLGFITGVATAAAFFIVENYVEDASLQEAQITFPEYEVTGV